MYKKYTPERLGRIRKAITEVATLEELAKIAEISRAGVLKKLESLTENDPENWPEGLLVRYKREYPKRVSPETIVDLVTLMLDKSSYSKEEITGKLERIGVCICERDIGKAKKACGAYWIVITDSQVSLDRRADIGGYLADLRDRTKNVSGIYRYNRKLLNSLVSLLENET